MKIFTTNTALMATAFTNSSDENRPPEGTRKSRASREWSPVESCLEYALHYDAKIDLRTAANATQLSLAF